MLTKVLIKNGERVGATKFYKGFVYDDKIYFTKYDKNNIMNLYYVKGEKEYKLTNNKDGISNIHLIKDNQIIYLENEYDNKKTFGTIIHYDLKNDIKTKLSDIHEDLTDRNIVLGFTRTNKQTDSFILHGINKKIYIVDVINKKVKIIDALHLKNQYLINENGDIIAETNKISNDKTQLIINKKTITETKNQFEKIQLFTYLKNKVYYIKNRKSVIVYDITTNKQKTILKVEGYIESSISNGEIIQAFGINNYKYKWYVIDNKIKEHLKEIEAKTKSNYFHLKYSNAEHWIVLVMSLNEPDYLIYYNLKNKKIKPLINNGLKKYYTIMPKEYEIMIYANDNLKLPCYITYPNKKKPPYPTIINIHGGPGSRDYQKFNIQSKTLASLGYCVVRVNFRRSTINEKHELKGYKQFGRKMITDIEDVIEYLIKKKIADKNKIGLYGYSYGGIAVLQAIIRKPNFYKFGISHSGRIDVEHNKKEQKDLVNFTNLIYPKKILNPIKHMDEFKIPMLLIRGGLDIRGQDKDEYKIFYETVKKYNNDIKLLYYKNEGHAIKKHYEDMWRNIVKFIKQYEI